MHPWKDFEPLVALHVTGCAPLAMREAVREALEEFCTKTHIWTVEAGPFDVRQGVADYDLPVDIDQRALVVKRVKFKDRPIEIVNTERLDGSLPTWTSSGQGAVPLMCRVFVEDGAQFVRLFPVPSETVKSALRFWVAVKPASNSEQVPDFFYEDWRRVLASGAVAKLAAVPGKDYTNPDLAVYHQRLFQMGVARAMNRVATGASGRGKRVLSRRFGS